MANAADIEHIPDLDSGLKEIEVLFEQSKFIQAEAKLGQLRERYEIDTEKNWFITDLEEKLTELRRLKNFIEEEEGWSVAHTSGKWTTEYKPDAETGFHSFRVNGICEINFFKVSAVCLETDLFHQWMPFCTQSNEILKTAEFGRLVHLIYGLWWPLSDRDLVLEAYGCDDVKNGEVLVYATSVDSHPRSEIPDAANNARLNMIQAGFYFKVLEPNKVQVTVIAQLDPGVSVPQFMINWISGKVMHLIPSYLVEAAKFDDDSIYAERVRANPQLYDRIRKIVEELGNSLQEENGKST